MPPVFGAATLFKRMESLLQLLLTVGFGVEIRLGRCFMAASFVKIL